MRRLLFSIALLFSGAISSMAQEREWNIDATETDAYLIFGTPGTDDVGVSFLCKVGSRKVTLFLADATAPGDRFTGRTTMKLSVNSAEFALPLKLSKDANGGRASGDASIVLDGKVLNELAQADSFSVLARGHQSSFPFDRDRVAEFRKSCGG